MNTPPHGPEKSQGNVDDLLPRLPVSPNRGGFTEAFKATGIDFNDTAEVLAWLDDIDDRGPR